MGEIKKAKSKAKRSPTPREKIIEVTNWLRELEENGKISLRTPEEAIEHFNLKVKPRDVQGWLSRRNLTSKQLYDEAIALKKKEVVNRFIGLEKVRETFMNKAINMLSEVTKNELMFDDKGVPILNGKGKQKKKPTIPTVKALQAINLFKNAIDNFTGFADLEKLEKMEQTASDSIRDFKHKKNMDKEKLELDRVKTNIEMEKFGILKSQVTDTKNGPEKKKVDFDELLFHIGRGYRKFLKARKLFRYLKGGRGSKKTKTTALEYIYRILNFGESNLLVIRQVASDHRTTTFTDLKWAARKLGVYDQFKFTTSPLEVTVKATGQKIYFRGMNDPLSITGITVDIGHLCWVWIEEAYQLRSEEEWDKVEMSIRGQLPKELWTEFTFTFNPWNSRHWLNKKGFRGVEEDQKILEEVGEFVNYEDENSIAITTAYTINEFLSKTDHGRYERMKEENFKRWLVEALGLWGVIEGLVFEEGVNWFVKDFDYQKLERENKERLRGGMDFGYNDPTSAHKVLVNDSTREIHIWGEYYERYKILEDLKEELEDFKDIEITADSSDPSKIRSLYKVGYDIEGAIKPPGSIKAGIDFLKGYKLIVHSSCVNLITEFTLYCWAIKDGAKLDKPVDANNHAIDDLRYSVEDLTLQMKGNSAFH